MAKASKKQALGRGLSVLLNDPKTDIQSIDDKNATQLVGSIVELDIDAITVNPFQPRTHFNENALSELAASISQLGIIQPITVRKTGFNSYQLISGERRLRASKLAGLKTITSYIRLAKDSESLEMALVENIQRQDLDPIEIGLSYQRLIDEIKLTQEELSARVGKKRSTITNYIRLLKLDPIIQSGIRDGFLSMGHGRALINVKSIDDQLMIYQRIIRDALSVRDTEALVRKINTNQDDNVLEKTSDMSNDALPDYISKANTKLSRFFGTDIAIKASKSGKGKITIPFASKSDFERIAKLLNASSED